MTFSTVESCDVVDRKYTSEVNTGDDFSVLSNVDLFAGAGGISCGLGMAGFRPLLANELVDQYAKTYKHNHPHTELVVGDVREVSESDIKARLGVSVGDVDLLAGGPPCQGFSVNAPIRSLDDERNHLFKDFIRVAEALLPKAIMIENVPGMVSLGRGTVVEQIYLELQKLGYSVKHKILFAGHYGVPQMRFRTIFIGIRKQDAHIEFPEPEFNASAVANFGGAKELCIPLPPLFAHLLKKHTSVWDAISDLPPIDNGYSINDIRSYATEASGWYQRLMRSKTEHLQNHVCAGIGKVNIDRLKHIPQGGSWRDIPYDMLPAGLKRARRSDHTRRYGRLHPDGLCSTILTKCDPHWGSFFHPTQDRIISVREAARIQSFPDDYVFTGNLSQQYEQVGNAVPPLLARAMGKKVRELLKINFNGSKATKRHS